MCLFVLFLCEYMIVCFLDDQSAQGHATINDSTNESGHNHSHLVKRLGINNHSIISMQSFTSSHTWLSVKSEVGVMADAGAKIKLTRQGSHSSSWANVSVLPTGTYFPASHVSLYSAFCTNVIVFYISSFRLCAGIGDYFGVHPGCTGSVLLQSNIVFFSRRSLVDL